MKRQIVNIINFVRAVEPREDVDLLEPVREQLALLEKHGLRGTFLLQYDALIDPRFTDLLKNTQAQIEVGAWLEIMQPLAEDAGLTWRGRPGFAWDWHAHVGFSVGYTPEERRKLIDTLMERFRQVFGNYPQSVGSWIIDAVSLAYLSDRYGVIASCNCKDQWGTDGYTLWGGYYGQAYYPSRLNAYTPAQTEAKQIPLPVFKMLGSDPIYQYDLGLKVDDDAAPAWQQVVTLEPVYAGATGGGGVPEWVEWYLAENFNGTCIHFGYAQAGQENSFGWPSMAAGLTHQLERIAQLARAGAIEVETLCESGRWFRAAFPVTPPTAIAALSDWKGEGRRSVWFSCRAYRLNAYQEGARFWIRDWHVFDEMYAELYLDAVCPEKVLRYDNLPVMDGNRWSGGGTRAGIHFEDAQGAPLLCTGLRVADTEDGVDLHFDSPGGALRIACREDGVTLSGPGAGFRMVWHSGRGLPLVSVGDGNELRFEHREHPYALRIAQGTAERAGEALVVRSDVCGTVRFEV